MPNAQAPWADIGQGFSLGSLPEAAADPLVIYTTTKVYLFLSALSITEIASSWQLLKKLLPKKEKVVL